jgi:hypothetical protein
VDLTFPDESGQADRFEGSYVLHDEAEGRFRAYVSGDRIALDLAPGDKFGEFHVEAQVFADMMVGTVSQGGGGKPIAGLVMFKPERLDIFGAWAPNSGRPRDVSGPKW